MGFGQAVATCFSKYATFSGRAKRSEYWYWILFVLIGSVCAFMVGLDLVFCLFFFVATILPSWAVAARRLHDINKSGWWQLLTLTIIGSLVVVYWLIKPSDEGENDYPMESP